MKIFGIEFKFNGFDIWHSGNFNPNDKANASHTHIKANITDFPTSLPANGGNADTVNGKTVAENVPAGAKFTDTTYSEITTSEIDAGTSSTLRTISGRRIKYILDKVQGWLNNKVDKIAGKGLSTEDYTTAEKDKLAGIESGANKYIHPSTSGNKHIPSGGSSGQFLKWQSDGTAIWDNVPGGLELGETSSTAYRGDRGKVAYDHSQSAHAPADAISKTNTDAYTPTANYHPATKKYVDDNVGGEIYHVGTSPPSDTNLFWIDTSE